MTDDQFNARMDRLTERHEALTQSVEIMSMNLEAQRLRGEASDKRIDNLSASLEKLVNIVRSHERRISGLEGQ
jgi:hypothetical protein